MPDDACLPYTSGANDQDPSCNAACSDVKTRVVKAKSSTQVGSSETAVKQAVMNGPLIATMTVYDDFMDYQSGVYKHVTGAVDGGHAVSIIGWNDADGAWICRNNWGTSWGEAGFFEIAYGDASGVGDETWSLTVTAPAAYTSLEGVRDGQVFSGANQSLSFDTVGVSDASASWTLAAIASSGSAAQEITGTQPAIDTTSVADGVYLLQAQATSGSTSVASEPREVYVLNGTENAGITFTSLKAGQKVTGTPTVSFTTKAAPVPLSGIHYQLIDSTGAIVTDDTWFGNTGPSMSYGWDTTRHPNGTYTVSLAGFARRHSRRRRAPSRSSSRTEACFIRTPNRRCSSIETSAAKRGSFRYTTNESPSVAAASRATALYSGASRTASPR